MINQQQKQDFFVKLELLLNDDDNHVISGVFGLLFVSFRVLFFVNQTLLEAEIQQGFPDKTKKVNKKN